MPRTTPPRPVDILAVFPELSPLARPAVRLHPRLGTPGPADSSVGGPLLWPAQEPWPTCSGPHVTDPSFLTVPLNVQRPDRTPSALIPVVQLFARELPGPSGLLGFDEYDLLQVLWCPVDHPETYVPREHVVWRQAASIEQILAEIPPPIRIQEEYTPAACVLSPELVMELPALLELPEDLQERIDAWESEGRPNYQDDLSVAPGWKLGGWAPWSVCDPFPLLCRSCGTAMVALLTISSGEWSDESTSWTPLEDVQEQDYSRNRFGNPPGVVVGRANDLQIYGCPADLAHPVQTNLQ